MSTRVNRIVFLEYKSWFYTHNDEGMKCDLSKYPDNLLDKLFLRARISDSGDDFIRIDPDLMFPFILINIKSTHLKLYYDLPSNGVILTEDIMVKYDDWWTTKVNNRHDFVNLI